MTHRDSPRARGGALASSGAALFLRLAAGCGDAQGTAAPTPPDGDAGALLAEPGQVVALAPSAGLLAGPAEAWAWRQVDGPPVDLRDGWTPQAHFVMPPLAEAEHLTFELRVTRGGTSTAETRVVRGGRGAGCAGGAGGPPPFVVFTAAKDLAIRQDLYLARLDGSEVFRLNGPLVPGGGVLWSLTSPDGRHVAYVADEDALGAHELFVAATDGSGAWKVSAPLVAGGDVIGFEWSPDGERLAYFADATVDGEVELFTVGASGDGHARASGSLVPGGFLFAYGGAWSPDGARLAYVGVQNTLGVTELFTARPDGSGRRRISAPVPAGGYTGYFRWSPLGEVVAYESGTAAGARILVAARPDGSGTHDLTAPTMAGVGVINWDWAPGGAHVAYVADQRLLNHYELFTSRPDGSDNTLVSSLAPPGGQIGGLAWSPDGARIAYVAYTSAAAALEVFTAGADGTANTRVSGPVPSGSLGFTTPLWSPDGGRLAFGRVSGGRLVELLTSPADRSEPVVVSLPAAAGGDVGPWSWSLDGERLVYLAEVRADGLRELFSTLPAGGPSARLSGTPVPGGSAQSFAWSRDGARVVYAADQLVDGKVELFVAAPDGSVPNLAISGPIAPGGGVFAYAVR